MAKVLIECEFASILKRDSLDEFIQGVTKKAERNEYTFVGEMDDMTRGRFDLKSWDDVETVSRALEEQGNFKLIDYMDPRMLQPDGGFGYPRYHRVFQDPETLITHEWQVGTKTTSELFETPGIDIGELQLKPGMHTNLHDIAYDIFQPIQKQFPEAAQQYGISQFYKQLNQFAAQTGELGDQAPNLSEGISQLHSQASEILKDLFNDQGQEVIEQFFH